MRRIEAVTGTGVLTYMNHLNSLLSHTASALKVPNVEDLPQKAAQAAAEGKAKDKEIAALNSRIAQMRIDGLFAGAEVIEDIRIVSALLSGTGPDALRTICEQVKDMRDDTIIVVAGTLGDKATIAASCGKQAVKKGAHAGNLVRAFSRSFRKRR